MRVPTFRPASGNPSPATPAVCYLCVPSCAPGCKGPSLHGLRPPCAPTPGSPPCAEHKGADRVISMTSREAACSPVSPAQEALALIALCLLEPQGCPPVPVLRALVPAAQVTCPWLLLYRPPAPPCSQRAPLPMPCSSPHAHALLQPT